MYSPSDMGAYDGVGAREIVTSSYIPRQHMMEFHARPNRFSILVFHRRAGKTVACINDLIDKAIQCTLPMPRFGYIAPLYKQAKSVAWAYLKLYAAPLIAKVMESELSVILKNGALIQLYGADNPDSLRGVYFDGVILDEYADMSPRLFGEVIAPTLVDRKGWAVFIGTVKGMNHFYDLWNDASAQSNVWYTKMLKASESGIIDAAELEMLAHLPGSDEDTFRQEFECDFRAAIRGAYYGKQLNLLETKGHMGSFPWDSNKIVYTSWDIGYTDDTSIWFYQYNGKEIAIVDFYTVAGASVGEVLDYLRTKPYVYGEFHLPHDAANKSFQTGKSTRELMIAEGARTRLIPNLSLQDGIQAVRVTLNNTYFNTDSPDVRIGLNALRIYQREWDDKRRMFKDQPLHDWASNPADSFRMLALAVNPTAAKKAKDKTLNTIKPVDVVNRVLNLENLFADRKAANKNGRI